MPGIFDGEEYDAREPMGYECVDKLSTPEENTEFSGDILPSDGAEVYLRTDLALAPVKAYVWKNVEGAKENEFGKVIIAREFASGTEMTVSPGETLVVDFGQNCAGVPSFVFKAAEGTVLTCLPAELLNDGNGAKIRGMDGPEGSCHRENLRIPHTGIRLDYTFAGGDNYVCLLSSLHLLRLPLCLHNFHWECCHQVVEVHPRYFHRKGTGDRHYHHRQRPCEQAHLQHLLGTAIQLPVYTHRLSAA